MYLFVAYRNGWGLELIIITSFCYYDSPALFSTFQTLNTGNKKKENVFFLADARCSTFSREPEGRASYRRRLYTASHESCAPTNNGAYFWTLYLVSAANKRWTEECCHPVFLTSHKQPFDLRPALLYSDLHTRRQHWEVSQLSSEPVIKS